MHPTEGVAEKYAWALIEEQHFVNYEEANKEYGRVSKVHIEVHHEQR